MGRDKYDKEGSYLVTLQAGIMKIIERAINIIIVSYKDILFSPLPLSNLNVIY